MQRLLLVVSSSLVVLACSADVPPTLSPPPTAVPDRAEPAPTGPSVEPERDARCVEGCAIVDVAAGYTHTCALREDGSVVCWGGNAEGQLGDDRRRHGDCADTGSTEARDCADRPVIVVGPSDVVALSSRGGLSTCALTAAGDVRCWGLDSVPVARGRDQLRERYMPERVPGLHGVVDVSDGFDHTCAVLADGRVACVGRNDDGQLGVGDTVARREAAIVLGLAAAVDVEVSVMRSFTCALTETGAYCWGGNEHGELADGRHDHGRCGDGLSSYDCSWEPSRAPLLDDAVELSLGALHGCALAPDGTVRCWGHGGVGQLGRGDDAGSSEPVAVPDLSGVVQVAAGGLHTCALLDSGAVRCWGANDEGQLGDGRYAHGEERCALGSELLDCARAPVTVVDLEDAVRITAGAKHTCALRATGDVVCWGWSADRQLGDGDRQRDAAPVTVVGLDEAR